MADEQTFATQAPIGGVGPRLKAAREAGGYSLEQMAGLTKIPSRMLVLIEAGDFAALPARTYATGFTRTYARVLGLNENEYVDAVRDELGMHRNVEQRLAPAFEPGDPARVPTARFAWLAAVAALVVIAAGLFFWRTFYSPAVTLPPLEEPTATAAPAVAPAPPPVAAVPTMLPEGTGIPGEVALPTGAAPAAVPAPAQPSSHRTAAVPAVSRPGQSAPVSAPTLSAPAPASTAQF